MIDRPLAQLLGQIFVGWSACDFGEIISFKSSSSNCSISLRKNIRWVDFKMMLHFQKKRLTNPDLFDFVSYKFLGRNSIKIPVQTKCELSELRLDFGTVGVGNVRDFSTPKHVGPPFPQDFQYNFFRISRVSYGSDGPRNFH